MSERTDNSNSDNSSRSAGEEYDELLLNNDAMRQNLKYHIICLIVKQIIEDNDGSNKINLNYFRSQRFKEIMHEYESITKSIFKDVKQYNYKANRKNPEFNIFRKLLDSANYDYQRATIKIRDKNKDTTETVYYLG